MTHITYEPQMPGMAFDGHAGAGPYGGDVVCAALSALMYTLIAALPDDTAVEMGDGHCRVRGGGPEP